MSEPEPRLRTVSPPSEAESSEGGREPRLSRMTLLLALALCVALALLLWSRFQLGNRIDVLETEARALKQAVVDREATIADQRATIAAHEERLGEARAGVEAVLDLLSRPVDSGR